jgi:urease accessory protein
VTQQTIFRVFSAALALIAFAAAPAEAHTIDTGAALAHGFAHPFTGLDHVLAMVAVGLWASHLGGRARWLVPASFVSVMAVAGGMAMAGVSLPFIETAIALTVVALGALIFARMRMPTGLGMAVVGSFALFHGFAHGLEAPAAAGIAYGAGFMAATAILHGIGIGFGVSLGGGAAIAAGVLLVIV